MSEREELLQVILTAITNLGGTVPARHATEEYAAYRVRCLNYLTSLLSGIGSGGDGIPANNSVATGMLQDLAVSTAKITDGAVTSAKIADSTITSTDLSPDLQTVISAAGVGAANFNPNFFLAGPSSGVAAPPSARAIVPAALPLLARNPGFIANVPTYAAFTGVMRLVATSEILDPLNAHSTSSGMFTVPAGMAGVWMLGAFFQTAEYGRFLCYATVNTTVSDDSNCLGLATQSHTLMRPYNLAAGDVIRWYLSYAEGVGGPGITIMNSSKVFAFLLFPTG